MSEAYDDLFDPGASVERVATASERFFEDHSLSDLAAEIQAKDEAGAPGAETETGTAHLPFRVCLPPAAIQRRHAARLVQALAARPLRAVDAAEQYSEPFAPSEDELGAIEDRARPEGRYLLALDPDEFRPELRGLTAPAIRKKLVAESRSSLTACEYLVVQRLMTAFYSDHRFDFYGSALDDTRWMWLPDSTLGDKTFMAYWNPGKRRVELSLCRTGSKNPRKGAYVTTIVPL